MKLWAAAVLALPFLGCSPVDEAEINLPAFAVAYIPNRDHAECAVTKVTDGDTVRIDCGTGSVPSRLLGYDTPETYRPSCDAEEKLGKKATAHLERVLTNAHEIVPEVHGTDKYQRALVRLDIDGRNLAIIMIEAGLAQPYDGGKRPDWCALLS